MDNNKEKTNINKFDINSEKLNLGVELQYSQSSLLKTAQYKYQDIMANVYKYFNRHYLITYSFNRIFFGLVTLLMSIVIVFLLVNAVTDDTQYLPDYFVKLNIQVGTEEYKNYLRERMILFDVYGDVWTRLGRYIVYLIPFVPKHIVHTEAFSWIESTGGGLNNVMGDFIASGGGMTKHAFDQLMEFHPGEFVYDVSYSTKWVYLGLTSSPIIGTPGVSDISELFGRAIPYSLAFGSIAVLISYLIGVPLGIQAAKYKGKKADSAINGVSTFVYAIPGTIIIIAVYLISVSVFGHSITFLSGSFWSKFWPMVALVILMTPGTVMLTRRYVVDEMSADYTKFALSKGLSETRVFYIHIFRNAGIRIMKQLPLDIAISMLGASILTEKQWAIPGMSPFIVNAVVGVKDSFVILGYISFATFIKVFATLASDLFMVALDPRVTLGKN